MDSLQIFIKSVELVLMLANTEVIALNIENNAFGIKKLVMIYTDGHKIYLDAEGVSRKALLFDIIVRL